MSDRYQGHNQDGSSVQNHSCGDVYPYVLGAQERPGSKPWGFVIAPDGFEYVFETLESAINAAIAFKRGDVMVELPGGPALRTAAHFRAVALVRPHGAKKTPDTTAHSPIRSCDNCANSPTRATTPKCGLCAGPQARVITKWEAMS